MKLTLFLIILTFLIVSCKTNSNTTHKGKTGNLFFSKIDISKTKPTIKNYTKNFKLNKDKFLNIHFSLEKPLIQSLKLLDLSLTSNELLEKGNF